MVWVDILVVEDGFAVGVSCGIQCGILTHLLPLNTSLSMCMQETPPILNAHNLNPPPPTIHPPTPGHWKLWHTPALFVVGQAVLLSQLGLFTLVRTNTDLLRSFGFAPGVQPVFISFTLFQIIIAPVDEVGGGGWGGDLLLLYGACCAVHA